MTNLHQVVWPRGEVGRTQNPWNRTPPLTSTDLLDPTETGNKNKNESYLSVHASKGEEVVCPCGHHMCTAHLEQ